MNVPAGATLEMSRSVALTVHASATALPAGTVGRIEVQRDDGSVVFTSSVTAQQDLASKVALPTGESQLTVLLRVPGQPDATLRVAVASNAAAATFQ